MDEHTRRRLPAEWENDGAILLSWPHKDTDWAGMLVRVTRCYVALSKAVIEAGQRLVIVAPDTSVPRRLLASLPQDKILYADLPTNDTWTRDFGPITVEEPDGTPVIVDFKFNGWGLKFAANHDNLVTSRLVKCGLLRGSRDNQLSFVLEGGSIESDGKGTLMTTSECLLSPNRNGSMTRAEIEEKLKATLGASHILWVDHGALEGDDTDSHIDTLARIAPDDTIIYTACDDPSDSHYVSLSKMEKQLKTLRTIDGQPYNLVSLPLPDPEYDEDGNRIPATYANYLVTPGAVLMPSYGQKMKDLLAARILNMVWGRKVIAVDCRALIRQHGSLHCATMQIPSSVICI
nr:agmatine deiminase [uncultured bacterium]